MLDSQPPAKEAATKSPEKGPKTREQLEDLKDKLPKKPSLFQMIIDLLKDFKELDEKERTKRIAAIFGAVALLQFFGIKQETNEEAESAETTEENSTETASQNPDEESSEEAPEQDEETVPKINKRREVRCDNLDQLAINLDPAGDLVPENLRGKSSYLLEYGLPADFDTFREEMIGFLAPGENDPGEALKRTVDILKRSPMGIYQCTPRYLFGFVDEFKKYDFDWEKEGQEEEKLRAMYQFLASRDLQKEAARGYHLSSASRYKGDRQAVSAAFYGGAKAGDALAAYKAGTATPEQIAYLKKPQGKYPSILEYIGYDKNKPAPKRPFDIEAELAATASRETGRLRDSNGNPKKTKPRDETWRQDQRFAYNQSDQTNNVA